MGLGAGPGGAYGNGEDSRNGQGPPTGPGDEGERRDSPPWPLPGFGPPGYGGPGRCHAGFPHSVSI